LFVPTVSFTRTGAGGNYQTDSAFVVLPEGPQAIVGQELGGAYFTKAGPVIEKQVARAGYRMAAWLDRIADAWHESQAGEPMGEEL
jgi:hypothetical protein